MECEVKIDKKKNKIFAPLKNKWLNYTIEEKLKQEFICKLVNSYGYSLNQIGQDVKTKNGYKADIAIWKTAEEKKTKKFPSIIIAVQCKAEHIKIRQDDYKKGFQFAQFINANFFIAKNQKELKIYNIKNSHSIYTIEDIEKIPPAEILTSNQKVENFIKRTKKYTAEEFRKTLSRCHNIIRNNDKLSPEGSFDEISKVLFIKIMYERVEKDIFTLKEFKKKEQNYEETIRPELTRINPKENKDYMQFLFDKTKENFIGDDIFESNDKLRIRKNSFEMILKELEYYNLAQTSDDIKGIAFEEFLGKTFRGELGQFFTPRTIVDFMVEILDPQEGEMICDPACGSGGFLIKSFDYIRNKIDRNIKKQREKLKEKYPNQSLKLDEYIQEEFNISNKHSRYYKLSHMSIYGTDANPRMARTAKMNMIMHGDGHGGVHHNDGLLNVNGIFENRFDIILTNPPFGARVEKSLKITEADKYKDEQRIKEYKKRYGDEYVKAMRQITDNIGEPLLYLYETGKMSTLTEVLFIERSLRLLKPGGRMGIVLPEGVLNNSNLQKIRDFVESKAKIILIVSIPQDVFIASGATVKPSLLFFKKFTDEEAKQWKEIKDKATKEIEEKYEPQTTPIKEKLALRGKEAPNKEEKKKLRKELKELQEKIETEIKAQIKKEFDYEIPIAEVEKAGISTTGAEIENELVPLAEEYKKYRTENNLWQRKFDKVEYEVLDDGTFYRLPIIDNVAQEPEVFYGK